MKDIDILEFVTDRHGKVVLPKVLYPRSWRIARITAVNFYNEYGKNDDWNKYVNKIRKAIGVESYCTWVKSKKHNMIGILAFYDPEGNEIKMKHFKNWAKLLRDILSMNLVRYNHYRPVEEFDEQLKIFRKHGFKPVGVSQMLFEDTFIFETKEEAHKAYYLLERDKDDKWIGTVVGWYYGREDFKEAVREYERDMNDFGKVKVLAHWLS